MRTIQVTLLFIGLLLAAANAGAAEETIATIETYGLGKVNRETVLEAVEISVGQRVPTGEEIAAMERKLRAVPGVEEADISLIRVAPQNAGPAGKKALDAQAGNTPVPIIYIGIRETGRPGISFRAAPTADAVLAEEIVDTYRRFDAAAAKSFREGHVSGDDSNGYALFGDEATRVIQRQFVPLAKRHYDRLVEVLRTSSQAGHRAKAAWVIGYAADKSKAAAELDAAARDPDHVVRNNAMRGLGVILGYAAKHPELSIEAPIDVYLDLLESVEWTDRNKAMAVLGELSAGGNEAVLTKLRERSLPALVEMARWQTEGHALMAYLLVGRIAGVSDEQMFDAWAAGKREEVIARALESANGT
ncbi:MAG TPA: hypothetical protein VHY91_26750 [Pirellulales bacterium]|jgi:hypothetical protein|nr:hypothetical protein [Pirellulales bacterium]